MFASQLYNLAANPYNVIQVQKHNNDIIFLNKIRLMNIEDHYSSGYRINYTNKMKNKI